MGEPVIEVMYDEYAQLNNQKVYKFTDQDALIQNQKDKSLNPINLVKVKRHGQVKGCSCADGQPQQEYIPREQCASSTISNTSLMLILLIAAKEKHHVVTANVAGAYLNAKMDDFVLVKFKGRALNIMCQVNPEYTKLIWKAHGQNVMYLQLAKALYVCPKLALLWYTLFRSTLEDMSLVLNKYDPCVTNKIICFDTTMVVVTNV